jgi:hypothetical protein
MSRYFPHDKNGRTLRIGDYVIVDYLRTAGVISSVEKDSWYRWTLRVKFDESQIKSLEVSSHKCEWVTKHRRLREQKLMVFKLEEL